MSLPPAKTVLPREKPLPVAKPPTKWERFAKAKGISHKTKEKREWDEEKQEWVNRWGRNGKSREGEDQWLHEVKNKDGVSVPSYVPFCRRGKVAISDAASESSDRL